MQASCWALQHVVAGQVPPGLEETSLRVSRQCLVAAGGPASPVRVSWRDAELLGAQWVEEMRRAQDKAWLGCTLKSSLTFWGCGSQPYKGI